MTTEPGPTAKPTGLRRLIAWRVAVPIPGRKLAVPGLLLLLLLCCCCSLTSVLLVPTSDRTPTPTLVAVVADQPAATPVPTTAPTQPAAPTAPVTTKAPAATPTPPPAATAAPSRTTAPTRTPIPTIPPTPLPVIGADVKLGNITWNVLSAKDMGNTLKSDNQFIKSLTTSGRFIAVRYKVTNGGTSELYYQSPDLVDTAKRKFGSSTDAYHWLPDEEECLLQKLNPGITKTCQAIYEIPSDATGLAAQITELGTLLGRPALVDLGLK